MSPKENSLFLVLKELCASRLMKERLVRALTEQLAEERQSATEAAMTALFDETKKPAACAMHGRTTFISDLITTIERM